MKILPCLILTLLFPSAMQAVEQQQAETAPLVRYNPDFAAFLKPKNMVWQKAPTAWDDAPFLGNGQIGMQIMRNGKDERSLRIEVARMDAQEHIPYDEQIHNNAWAYRRYRLPIGHFTLTSAEPVTGWNLELDLYNAELTGTLSTAKGSVNLRAYAHATEDILVVELEPKDGQPIPELTWNGYQDVSPRTASWAKDTGKKEEPGAEPGPPGRKLSKPGQVNVWEQALRPSGQASTAWKTVSNGNGKTTLYISIRHSFPKNTATDDAADIVRKAASAKPEALTASHRAWWHAYYPGAFVSLPDSYWDAFYWIQIYKIGAGMRENGPVLDLQGPWTGLPRTAWPGVWWNLNVQLTYWPCYTGNRLREAMSLPNNLKRYRDNLILNVGEPYRKDSAGIPRASGHDIHSRTGIPGGKGGGSSAEVGSLPWVCHNLYLHYRMTMDDAFLRDDVYPLLRRAINYYLHFLEEGDDGKLHLPPTLSPEYGEAPDCNYDLALLRWGCMTLLDSCERLKINDPLIPKWKQVLATLADYPVDDNGYMIGRGVPYKKSHRHYSHLFMVYPLHIVDTGNPGTAALVDKSIRHWHSLKNGLQGYSFSGGASLYATLGRGNDALEMLDGLKRYIRPNTLYKESWPVMETPLSGAASIHDMLLQSSNNIVKIFPAMPDAWADALFHDLRAEGAFLVSAERKGGKTQWVRVKSLAGEPLKLATDIASGAVINGSGATSLKQNGPAWEGTMPKGSEILIALPGVEPVVTPVPVVDPKTFGMP